MGIIYSTVQCNEEGKCYKKRIPIAAMAAMNNSEEDPLSQFAPAFQKELRKVTKKDIEELSQCLKVPSDEELSQMEPEAAQKEMERISDKLTSSMCCDQNLLEKLKDDFENDELYVLPLMDNGKLQALKVCDPENPEEGCRPASPSDVCRLGAALPGPGEIVPVEKLLPSCGGVMCQIVDQPIRQEDIALMTPDEVDTAMIFKGTNGDNSPDPKPVDAAANAQAVDPDASDMTYHVTEDPATRPPVEPEDGPSPEPVEAVPEEVAPAEESAPEELEAEDDDETEDTEEDTEEEDADDEEDAADNDSQSDEVAEPVAAESPAPAEKADDRCIFSRVRDLIYDYPLLTLLLVLVLVNLLNRLSGDNKDATSN